MCEREKGRLIERAFLHLHNYVRSENNKQKTSFFLEPKENKSSISLVHLARMPPKDSGPFSHATGSPDYTCDSESERARERGRRRLRFGSWK